MIAKNPTNGTTVPKCNYPEKQILGDNQLETFLEAIKGHEYWCDFFYVEVMTGLRRGEICGLRWQDINFEENKLQVKRSVSVKKGGGVSIGETKTETGVRCIQMPPSVAELLKSKKQTAITEWVFPHFLHPEQPISPASAYRKLKVILKNAELPLMPFGDWMDFWYQNFSKPKIRQTTQECYENRIYNHPHHPSAFGYAGYPCGA